ncbi:MAG: 23S rRNA (adenine(2503)-C(2))-methyltransferase RlmN [Lachnospiraceae bacterium]|nr:23S rRNA (adenine(2503)-C(2))-methyltransferase RlmN [Lachnospiraceae bacterium]
MMKEDLRSLDHTQLQDVITLLGEKKYRADQIYRWLHVQGVQTYAAMTNVPAKLTEQLDAKYMIYPVRQETMLESRYDGTRKYLFSLHDGNVIESVFMRYEHGNAVCISSQVGCNMGCRFCASTIDGKVRDLTPGEMLGQIYAVMEDTGEKVSHVVVMGSGEPLENYVNLLTFLKMLTDEYGQNISQRNVTVSTCGLCDRIKTLADEQLQITLAISLHAPDDAKRKELMPVANRYSLPELIDACRYYFDKTGRRITFEYALIRGENDSEKDAETLAALVRGMNCHINLIPVNPVRERNYQQSDKNAVLAFKNKLEKNHINVTIRREMGRDIDGACGQLRRRHLAHSGDA